MLESARYQWQEGLRRLEAEGGETVRARQLNFLVEAVVDELRRRVGHTFTLTELASAYNGAEDWAREAVVDAVQPKFRAGVRDAALIQDAAFARFARGASDYAP